MLNAVQLEILQALIGNALDQDHDMADWPEYLPESVGGSAEDLRAIAAELAKVQSSEPSELVQAARQLNENLHDSTPMTDQITSRAAAQDLLRVIREHEQALSTELAKDSLRARKVWLVPAPWEGPELELDPAAESGGPEPRVPSAARALWVCQQLAELVETEPARADRDPADRAEQTLARVLLSIGALYSVGAGTLSQCCRTALIWERG